MALRSRKPLIAGTGVAVLVVLGDIYWLRQSPETAQAARAPAPRAVSVSAVAVARQDVPIYLTGLGAVQASFTVGIHSQVDGKLQEVLFTEGQHVSKGDILAKIDPRLFQASLDQAKAKRAQDEAQLISYEKDLGRFKSLAVRGFETPQNTDAQQAKVDGTKALLQADAAMIATAQTQLDYTNIVAPSDGRMGLRLVDPGNIVHASDQQSIAILTRVQPIMVLFTLPDQTLDDVRDAQGRGAVEVEAYDRDNRRKLSVGTLQTIDNVIDPATANYRLKAVFTNEDERLWPGEFVNARLLVGTRANALVVPNVAVQRGPKGLFAWVVTPNNTAEARPIEIGPAVGDITIVTAGLNDGDRVVTGGQYNLQVNAPVSVNVPQQSQSQPPPT